MDKIKLHNGLWWLLVIAFPLSITLALLWKNAIWIYGGCFFILLILKKIKKTYN